MKRTVIALLAPIAVATALIVLTMPAHAQSTYTWAVTSQSSKKSPDFVTDPLPARSADQLIATLMGSAAVAVPMTDGEMDAVRGAGFSSSVLSALLGAFPPQNTVEAQVGGSAPVINSGTGPQTFALSTPTVTVNLSATNPSSLPPISLVQTQNFVTTQSFTTSFAFQF